MREGTSPSLLFIAFFTSHRSPLSERLEQASKVHKKNFSRGSGGWGWGGWAGIQPIVGLIECKAFILNLHAGRMFKCSFENFVF